MHHLDASATAIPDPQPVDLRTAVEKAPVGVGVCDQDGTVLIANECLARLLRRPRAELIGSNFLSVIHPAEQDEVKALYTRAVLVAGADPYERESEQNEVRYVTGDGETRWAHVTWSATAPDESGVQHVVAHVTDLTRRRVIEDELVETRQLLRVALEKSSVGIVITDMQKRIRYANSQICALLGYTEEELCAKTFPDITHPEDRDKSLDAFRQMLDGTLDRHQTIKRYVRSDGKLLYCRRIAIAARGRDGAPRSTLVLIEPIGVV